MTATLFFGTVVLMVFPKPWSVQIELVEGCQRRCRFCGINGLVPKGQFRFMSMAVAALIARGVAGWHPLPRIEFAMHGEPLLHPSLDVVLQRIRTVLPATQLQLTTNGLVMFGNMESVWKILRPVNVVVVDLYADYGAPLRERIERWAGQQTFWRCVDFYREDFNPYHNHGGRGHVIVLMDDLERRSGQRRQRKVQNHVGYNADHAYLASPLAKMCTLPFREMAVRFDGRVALCCNDWGAEYECGVVRDAADIQAIWSGGEMMAARRLLASRMRTFRPCKRCDFFGGMRSGLIPAVEPPTRRLRLSLPP